jgi:hypothetical protein
MTYLIFFSAGAVLLVAAPALVFGRMVEFIVRHHTRDGPP